MTEGDKTTSREKEFCARLEEEGMDSVLCVFWQERYIPPD
jgi:hypothetical protein